MMNSIVIPPGWESDMDSVARLDFLIHCVRHKKHVPFASKCFEHLGPDLIGLLVQEITDSNKSPMHRARLVETIGVTGGSLTLLQSASLVAPRLKPADRECEWNYQLDLC